MIFVAGATGILGMEIVRRLRQRGEKVRAYVRGAAPRPELAGLNVEIFSGDLDDRQALAHTASLFSSVASLSQPSAPSVSASCTRR